MILLACLLASSGCERSTSRAQEADRDPFQRLDLIRPNSLTAAPDFSVATLAARPLSLADFRQRVVLLNFWATWCPPCREEMPSMERLYQRYKDRGLAILALSIDKNAGAVPPFVASFRLTFPIGLDPKSAVAQAYGMRALPTTVLIDRVGQVVALALGARDWDSPAAHALAEVLLSAVAEPSGDLGDLRTLAQLAQGAQRASILTGPTGPLTFTLPHDRERVRSTISEIPWGHPFPRSGLKLF